MHTQSVPRAACMHGQLSNSRRWRTCSAVWVRPDRQSVARRQPRCRAELAEAVEVSTPLEAQSSRQGDPRCPCTNLSPIRLHVRCCLQAIPTCERVGSQRTGSLRQLPPLAAHRRPRLGSWTSARGPSWTSAARRSGSCSSATRRGRSSTRGTSRTTKSTAHR